MASANVKQFTDANFEAEVMNSAEPVLVDFWAEWCGPCRMLAPTIEKVADQFVGKVKVGKVNTDDARDTASKLGIMQIPTVIVFKGGKVVKKIIGLKPEAEFVNTLNEVLR
jgi:thioredoxin 1